MAYALPYLALLAAFALLAYWHRRAVVEDHRAYANWLSAALFLFFFGFRGFVNYDWTAYYPEFYSLPSLYTLFTQAKWTFEPGFTLLAVACKSIYAEWFFFQFVCSAINTLLIVRFWKRYSPNWPLAFAIYMCMNGVTISTDLMRNSISILLFVNAIHYIGQKRFLPYLAHCLLGVLFHVSALAYIPLYFVLGRKINKRVLIGVFIVANAVCLLHIPVVLSIVDLVIDLLMPSTKLWVHEYLEMDATTGSFLSIGYLERLLTACLVFAYIGKLRAMRPEGNVFINSVIIYICLFLFLSEFRTISVRVSNLFVYAYWIIWIDLIGCFHYRNNRLLFSAFLAAYCVLKTISSNHTALSHYDNILFGAKSYTERLVLFRRHFNDK